MNTPQPFKASTFFENFSAPAPRAKHLSVPHKASEMIEESEKSYHYLFESNPHPMWIYDCETLKFLQVNDAAIAHYGYSQDEFLAMTLRDIRPEEDIPLLVKTVLLHGSGKGQRGVWRHRKKDGQIIDVEVTTHDFRFRGRSARLGHINDITQNRRIERALQQSEQEQRLLAEHLEKERERLAEAQAIAKVGSWELNLTTNALFWSEETYRIFGIDPLKCGASYEAFVERVHPDDRATVNRAYTESIANRTSYAIDHRMLMKDGSTKIVHERCQTIYDAGGQPLRSIGTVQDITATKQTEQQLTQSLDLLRAVTEGTTDAVFAKDTQGRYLMINTPGAQFVGKTPEEIIGHDDTHIFAPETAARTIEIDRFVMQSGATHSIEGAGVAAGVKRTYQSSRGPLRDRSGNITGVVGISRDITERRLAEETARAMTRGARCLLWYAFVEDQAHGLQWDIETADDEAAQQFFPVAQAAGQSYAQAWAGSRMPEDSLVMRARATEALHGGQKEYTNQFRCRRADGEWRWLNEMVRIETLSPGHWHCVGVCTDVTEQKQAEEERDRFFTLSLDLLCIIGSDDYFVRLNPAFERVLGFTPAELMARPTLDFVHPEDREATIAQSIKVRGGECNLHFENRYLCRDGSYRWLAWTSIAFQGLRYGAARDVTQLKETEAALRRSNEELEARVARRTAQIMETNAQLVQAMLEADTANIAKSEFLSRMSHELRTPLNAILGFGQILDKQTLTPLQKESVEYILKGGRHLLDLINEVLDIARVEAGHIDLSLEPISLSDVVSESCALVRPLAAERNILIDESDCISGRGHVLADLQRLKQVLINLLSNGIKYNRPGGHVRIYCIPQPGDRIRIAVQDTGLGITPEEQEKLFIPFERLTAARSGVEGTGLGLVIAQRLVTAMGGLLTLESRPGEGATFFIELPSVPSPEEAIPKRFSDSCDPEPQPPGEQSATVLYIEDNLSNLRLLEVVLRNRPDVTLMSAMQGSVGLDLARQHAPDLILLDVNLPDISGQEVLTRLQASALTRDIPVIVLSADATASQVERLWDAGARAYLTKPLDVTEFLYTLDRLLPNDSAGNSPEKECVL